MILLVNKNNCFFNCLAHHEICSCRLSSCLELVLIFLLLFFLTYFPEFVNVIIALVETSFFVYCGLYSPLYLCSSCIRYLLFSICRFDAFTFSAALFSFLHTLPTFRWSHRMHFVCGYVIFLTTFTKQKMLCYFMSFQVLYIYMYTFYRLYFITYVFIVYLLSLVGRKCSRNLYLYIYLMSYVTRTLIIS